MTDVLASGPPTSELPTSELPSSELLTPIDHYLREQQQLTAVERFSQRHAADLLPEQARYYRDLIPLERPGPGQQYGFEVDLDRCTGCKACVSACHSLNGLDEDESFRSVGVLVGSRSSEPWQQTVTTACHHCVDPACLDGCPVDAYEKDPVTGIVKHLDDQCIGCSYCTLTCPYEVPRFNEKRGIVRKCDMCSDRLAEGEAPACVQACPTSAISIGVVELADVIAAAHDTTLVPGAPSSALTVPTTTYRSRRPTPDNAVAVDALSVRPAHAHTPLAIMLVLTQASVGAFTAELLLRTFVPEAVVQAAQPYAALGALAIGLIALAASVLHLGRPWYAWRAVIGLGHSWLSREIVVFAAFAGAASVYGLTSSSLLGVAVVVAGIAGVMCSVMIYAVTGRRWWKVSVTAPKFFLSAAVTGPSLLLALALPATGIAHRSDALHATRPVLLVIMGATLLKLMVDASVLLHLRDDGLTDLRRTAMLLADDLRWLTWRRLWAGVIGGVAVPAVLMLVWSGPSPSFVGSIVLVIGMLGANLVGELAERRLFFAAVSAPRMPGALR